MKKVLIIDDEERIRAIYKRVCLALGKDTCQVFEASDAVAATNILIRENIDLVLLDIRMPGINGQTMFEVIREYTPDVDVIIASVFPVYQQRELFPKARDYYDKSQGPFVLLDKLANVLL
jgi:YesN/AraC family two-component response regulator